MSAYPPELLTCRRRVQPPKPAVTKHGGGATIETFRDGRALLLIDGGACGIYPDKQKAKDAISIYQRMGRVSG